MDELILFLAEQVQSFVWMENPGRVTSGWSIDINAQM